LREECIITMVGTIHIEISGVTLLPLLM
jgi:hypothetical protein